MVYRSLRDYGIGIHQILESSEHQRPTLLKSFPGASEEEITLVMRLEAQLRESEDTQFDDQPAHIAGDVALLRFVRCFCKTQYRDVQKISDIELQQNLERALNKFVKDIGFPLPKLQYQIPLYLLT